mgnify:CR=1 FL=1
MLCGRQVDCAKLVGYILSGENAITIAARGRNSEPLPAERVLSTPELLQLITAAAASKPAPVLAVVGEAGVGKTALLRAVHQVAERMLPLRCITLFDEERKEEMDDLFHDLLRLAGSGELPAPGAAQGLLASMAAAALGAIARQSSTLLLADLDSNHSPSSAATGDEVKAPILSWLPAPLPLGLRAIVAVTRDSPAHLELGARNDVAVLHLAPLADGAARELAARAGCPASLSERLVGMSSNPRWLLAACDELACEGWSGSAADKLIIRASNPTIPMSSGELLRRRIRRLDESFRAIDVTVALQCLSCSVCNLTAAELASLASTPECCSGQGQLRVPPDPDATVQVQELCKALELRQGARISPLVKQAVPMMWEESLRSHLALARLLAMPEAPVQAIEETPRARSVPLSANAAGGNAARQGTFGGHSMSRPAARCYHLSRGLEMVMAVRRERALPEPTSSESSLRSELQRAIFDTAALDDFLQPFCFHRLRGCLRVLEPHAEAEDRPGGGTPQPSTAFETLLVQTLATRAESLARTPAAVDPASKAAFRRLYASAGAFLSWIGCFGSGRQVLLEAQRLAEAASAAPQELGEILLHVAMLEVRHWDSLRRWTLRDLDLLLASSRRAVDIFRTRVSAATRESGREGEGEELTARLNLCAALSRLANGCFKAGCVADGTEARHVYLDAAERAVAEARGAVVGIGPTQQLGQAVLVHGVTVLVRAGLPPREEERAAEPDRWARAISLFTEAEAILVASVGAVNECSIYTHANLAEVHLRLHQHVNQHEHGERSRFYHLASAMSHLCTSCSIGLAYFGKNHPNCERKLRELYELLTALGLHPFAMAVRTATCRDDLVNVRAALQHVLRVRPGPQEEHGGGSEEEEVVAAEEEAAEEEEADETSFDEES